MGKGADEMSRIDEPDASPLDRDDFPDDQPDAADAAEPDLQVIEIRENIEQTRTQMSETIDELQERLNPSALKEQVKEQVQEQYEQIKETMREATIGKVENMAERVGDTLSETRRGIVGTIKANPIPAALVGIGLAWMWMNRGSKSSGMMSGYGGGSYRSTGLYDEEAYPYSSGRTSGIGQRDKAGVWDRTTDAAGNLANKVSSTMGNAVGQVQETAGNFANKAKDTVSGVVDQAQETAGYLAGQAQHQARRVEDRFKAAIRETPLAVGAVALALGAAAGLAIPQTRKENQWMGEARDTLVDKAQSVAHGTLDQVQQVAQRVTEEVAGSDDQGQQGQQGGQGGQQANRAQQSGGGRQGPQGGGGSGSRQ
jgi:uncharacterized protein YjbJ (UPF0337 family)